MLNVIKLNAITLIAMNVIKLNTLMLNVIMLSVVAGYTCDLSWIVSQLLDGSDKRSSLLEST